MCRRENIEYWLIFPSADQKDEYMTRALGRGNSQEFIERTSISFDKHMERYARDTSAKRKIVLKRGEYLENALGDFLDSTAR